MVMAYFKIISQRSPGEIEKSHINPARIAGNPAKIGTGYF
jgi:hypothetical protein